LASVALKNGIDGWSVFIGKWGDFKFYLPTKRLVFKNLTRFIGSLVANQRQFTFGFEALL
jgi:hypothetical protein